MVLLSAACAEKPAPSEPRSSLRVPLPEGWKATAVAGGLHVGPPSHQTLQLESTTRELPTLDALAAAVEREKAILSDKESDGGFVAVRYRLADGEGFLGVRQTGPKTIWCSTARGVSAAEIDAAMTVCRDLSWDASAE
jgi:hypothetical protein